MCATRTPPCAAAPASRAPAPLCWGASPVHQGKPVPSALASVLTPAAPPWHRAPRCHRGGAQTLGPLRVLPSTCAPAALTWYPWPGQLTPRGLRFLQPCPLPIGLQAGVSTHGADGEGTPAERTWPALPDASHVLEPCGDPRCQPLKVAGQAQDPWLPVPVAQPVRAAYAGVWTSEPPT